MGFEGFVLLVWACGPRITSQRCEQFVEVFCSQVVAVFCSQVVKVLFFNSVFCSPGSVVSSLRCRDVRSLLQSVAVKLFKGWGLKALCCSPGPVV